jgi:hypothetical protein
MWWVVMIVVVVAVFAFFEWRARDKPLVRGLGDHRGTHNAARNEARPMTGGHNTDRRN